MKLIYQFDEANAYDVQSMLDAFHHGFRLTKIQKRNGVTEFTLKKGK